VPRALLLLVLLQARGWLRYLTRNLFSVKGVLFALFALLTVCGWLSLLLNPAAMRQTVDPDEVLASGPPLLLAYCLFNVLASTGERAIYFSPAEIQFLFSGPFGRRQLLVYKIVWGLLLSVPSAVLFGVIFRVYAQWWLGAAVGTLLIMLFVQLFGMALKLSIMAVGTQLYTRLRRVLVVALLAAAALVALRGDLFGGTLRWPPTGLPLWRGINWPLSWFFKAFVADRWPDLVEAALAGLAVNAVLLGVIFGVRVDYLEGVAASSGRVYARLQRLRGGKPAAADEPSAPPAVARWTLPMLTFLGGAGPTFWRQLLTGLRQPTRLAALAVMFGFMLTGTLLGGGRGGGDIPAPPVLVGGFLILIMTVFLTTLVPFDFRGDLDRMATLKTLPTPSWQLAAGQLLAPVLLVTALQWLALAVLTAVSGGDAGDGVAVWWPAVAAVFAPAANFLLFAVENLVFLLMPTRLTTGSPADLQAIGRNVLLQFLKMVTLAVAVVAAGAVGVAVWLLTGHNLAAGLAVAWLALAAAGVALVPVVAAAYDHFDVGHDTPPQ